MVNRQPGRECTMIITQRKKETSRLDKRKKNQIKIDRKRQKKHVVEWNWLAYVWK